jgi:hypothetical protein
LKSLWITMHTCYQKFLQSASSIQLKHKTRYHRCWNLGQSV